MIDIMTQENEEVSAIVLDQAARLFQGEVTRHLLADADEGAWQQALWQQVAGAGLHLALVPEADGGAGLSLSVGLAVMRQAAQHALPLPLGETMLAHALWAVAGGELADDVHEQPATLAPESGCENGGVRMPTRCSAPSVTRRTTGCTIPRAGSGPGATSSVARRTGTSAWERPCARRAAPRCGVPWCAAHDPSNSIDIDLLRSF